MDKTLLNLKIAVGVSIRVDYHLKGKMKGKITSIVFAGNCGWAGGYKENPQTLFEVINLEIKSIKRKLEDRKNYKPLKILLSALKEERINQSQLQLF